MASEMDQSRFDDLLSELSKKDYPGNKFSWLRCLLYDNLKIGELLPTHKSGLQLFSKLREGNNISYCNVEILSEIAELTGLYAAKTRINDYKKEIGDRYDGNTGPRLTEYRKALYKSLREVGPDELPDVVAFYQLDHEGFTNIWDCVFHLEKHKLLSDTPEKIKRFGRLLNPTAKSILDKLRDRPRPRPATIASGGPLISTDTGPTQEEVPYRDSSSVHVPVPVKTRTTGSAVLWTSTEISKDDYLQLLVHVSSWWGDHGDIFMLKVLLSDFEEINRIKLEEKKNPYSLFELLQGSGHLSPSNVDVLIEAIALARLYGIEDKIKKQFDDFPGFTKILIRKFSVHRRNLIDFGFSISSKENIEKIGHLYGLKNMPNVWGLIYELERNNVLTLDKKEEFIAKLKQNGMENDAKMLQRSYTN